MVPFPTSPLIKSFEVVFEERKLFLQLKGTTGQLNRENWINNTTKSFQCSEQLFTQYQDDLDEIIGSRFVGDLTPESGNVLNNFLLKKTKLFKTEVLGKDGLL